MFREVIQAEDARKAALWAIHHVMEDVLPVYEDDGSGQLKLRADPAKTNLIEWSDDYTEWTAGNSAAIVDGALSDPDITKSSYFRLVAASFDGTKRHTVSMRCAKDSVGRATRFPQLKLTLSGSTLLTVVGKWDTKTGEYDLSGTNSDPDMVMYLLDEITQWRVVFSFTSSDTSNTTLRLDYYPAVGASATWTNSVNATGSTVISNVQSEEGDLTAAILTAGTTISRAADQIQFNLAVDPGAGTCLIKGWSGRVYNTSIGAGNKGVASLSGAPGNFIYTHDGNMATHDGTSGSAVARTLTPQDEFNLLLTWVDSGNKRIGYQRNHGAWAWNTASAYDGAFASTGILNLADDTNFTQYFGGIEIYSIDLGLADTLTLPAGGVPVFLNHGQSNLEGRGVLADAVAAGDSSTNATPNVRIFTGTTPTGPVLQAGVNSTEVDPTLNIGPEMQLAQRLNAAYSESAIIKYAVGGSALSDLYSGNDWNASHDELLATFIALIKDSLAVLIGEGKRPFILGDVFWQCEKDATSAEYSAAYRANLGPMFARLRAELGVNIPVLLVELGDISPDFPLYAFDNEVNNAQRFYTAQDDPKATLLPIEGVTYNPGEVHADYLGAKLVGERSFRLAPFTDQYEYTV